MSKKIFFFSLVLFLVFLGLLFWMGYFGEGFFSSKKTEIKTAKQAESSALNDQASISALEKSGNKRMEKIVDGSVAGAIFSKEDKKIVFYSNQNFIKADQNGQNRQSVGAHPFGPVEKVIWSLNKDKAVVKDSSGNFFFDLKKEEVSAFPLTTSLLSWGFLNNQILYEYHDQKKNRRILDATFELTGQNWEEIGEIPYANALLALHPLRNEALLFPDPGKNSTGDVLKVKVGEKKIEKFFSYYKGIDFLFSPSGKKVLESYVKEDGRMSLGIIDWESGVFQDLNFPTSVKKCAWKKSEAEVVCAALLSAEKVDLPFAWENKNGSFQDLFWTINIQNGKQTRLLEPTEGEVTDAEGLFFDDQESRLFFIDRISGGLFRVNLPNDQAEPKN